MFEHIVLNSLFYLSGYAFLSVLGQCSPLLKHSMAYICGTLLWGIACVFLMLVHLPLVLPLVFITIGILIGITHFLLPKREPLFSRKKLLYKECVWFAVCFPVFIIANMLLDHFWYPRFTFDSYAYLAAAKAIAYHGTFPVESPGSSFFLISRMAQLPMLLAAGNMMGIDLYFSIFPLFSLYLLMFTLAVAFALLQRSNLSFAVRIALVSFGGGLMMCVPQYFYHSFYIHTNLLTAGYYFGAVTGILFYKINQDRSMLVLAAMFLGASTLVRIEMIFFAFIPLVILVAFEQPAKKDFSIFMAAFLLVTYSWHFYRLYYTGLSLSYHNFGAAELLSFFLFLAVWGLTVVDKVYAKLVKNAHFISIGLLTCLLIILIVLFRENFKEAVSMLYQIIFHNKGQANWGWGRIWTVILVAWFVSPVVKKDIVSKALFYFIGIFFLLRVIFYSTPLLTGMSHVNSGSRILLHLYPAAILFLLLIVGTILREIQVSPETDSESSENAVPQP